jgi:hypothetical protein
MWNCLRDTVLKFEVTFRMLEKFVHAKNRRQGGPTMVVQDAISEKRIRTALPVGSN